MAHSLVGHLHGLLVQHQLHQDVPVRGHLGILLQGNLSGVVAHHLGVQGQEHGEHVGEAIAAKNGATHRGGVAELHAHNVLDGIGHSMVRPGIESRVLLQLAQGDHTADLKRMVCLHNGVQPQAGQVNGSVHTAGGHFHPVHTAQDEIGFLLVQFAGLFQALRPDILSDGQQDTSSKPCIFKSYGQCTTIHNILYRTFMRM